MAQDKLRVAVDGAFSDWNAAIGDGAEIAFIPPVSGG
jgi:molybdopterin synthase sulfur carrier subunit